MKAIYKLSGAALALLAVLCSMAFISPAEKAETNKANAAALLEESMHCEVPHEDVVAYLQGAPHYHTVYWVEDIPGSCNKKAGLEACKTATVYVSGGRIVGHQDVVGVCD